MAKLNDYKKDLTILSNNNILAHESIKNMTKNYKIELEKFLVSLTWEGRQCVLFINRQDQVYFEMHISKSISKDQRSITFLYETLNNPLTGKNLSIMNVFDLVTELRLMFETNATNESIYIKTFSYFRNITPNLFGKNCKLWV